MNSSNDLKTSIEKIKRLTERYDDALKLCTPFMYPGEEYETGKQPLPYAAKMANFLMRLTDDLED